MNKPIMAHVKLLTPQTWRGKTHPPGTVLHVTAAIAGAWTLHRGAKVLSAEEARAHQADVQRRGMAEREKVRRALGLEEGTAAVSVRPSKATRPM